LERYASLHNTVAPENDERAVKEAQEIDPEEKQQIRSALSEAFGIWRDLPETGDEFVRSLRQSDQGRMEDLDLV
jgi:hypothetical protein